jgi:hypothetical protein
LKSAHVERITRLPSLPVACVLLARIIAVFGGKSHAPGHTRTATPFRWTATFDSILVKVLPTVRAIHGT